MCVEIDRRIRHQCQRKDEHVPRSKLAPIGPMLGNCNLSFYHT